MDAYTADRLLDWYERIERGVLEFAQHVPLTEDREWLDFPLLASYLVDACGLIDSIFRDMTPDPAPLANGPIPKKKCEIPHFAELHARPLDLPNTRSIMLVSPLRLRSPFSPWTTLLTSGRYSDLDWWIAHNKLKHDRLAYIHLSTLKATLDALCGLHQIISRRLDHVAHLVRRGWFPRGLYPIDHIIKESEKGHLPECYVVQAKLFATPVGPIGSQQKHEREKHERQFPSDLKDLRLHDFQCNEDLHRYFGSTG